MALENDIVRLARTPPFSRMPREAIQLLAFASEKITLAPGQILFSEGELADEGYFVLSGSLTLQSRGQARERVQLAGPDALVGEMALFAQVRRPASASARDATIVLRISRTMMVRVLNEFPNAAAQLRAELADRNQTIVGKLEDVRARVLDAI